MRIGRNEVAVGFTLAVFLFALMSCGGCGSVPLDKDSSDREMSNLNEPNLTAPHQVHELPPNATGEDVWRNRCGECHAPEKGLDKFHGEQWEYVIAQMIAKPDAHFTPKLAQLVYEYLYKRTRKPGDPPWDEVIAGKSQWSTETESENTTPQAGYAPPPPPKGKTGGDSDKDKSGDKTKQKGK